MPELYRKVCSPDRIVWTKWCLFRRRNICINYKLCTTFFISYIKCGFTKTFFAVHFNFIILSCTFYTGVNTPHVWRFDATTGGQMACPKIVFVCWCESTWEVPSWWNFHQMRINNVGDFSGEYWLQGFKGAALSLQHAPGSP